jgi:hypothetical protein
MITLNALVQEIIDKFRQLDRESRRRVLDSLEREQESSSNLSVPLHEATDFRAKLREKYGKRYHFGVQDMLDEIRGQTS